MQDEEVKSLCCLFHHCLTYFIFKTLEEKIGREVGKNLLKEKYLGGILARSMKNLGGKQRNESTTVLKNPSK